MAAHHGGVRGWGSRQRYASVDLIGTAPDAVHGWFEHPAKHDGDPGSPPPAREIAPHHDDHHSRHNDGGGGTNHDPRDHDYRRGDHDDLPRLRPADQATACTAGDRTADSGPAALRARSR
jgi:hypothetical protein